MLGSFKPSRIYAFWLCCLLLPWRSPVLSLMFVPAGAPPAFSSCRLCFVVVVSGEQKSGRGRRLILGLGSSSPLHTRVPIAMCEGSG